MKKTLITMLAAVMVFPVLGSGNDSIASNTDRLIAAKTPAKQKTKKTKSKRRKKRNLSKKSNKPSTNKKSNTTVAEAEEKNDRKFLNIQILPLAFAETLFNSDVTLSLGFGLSYLLNDSMTVGLITSFREESEAIGTFASTGDRAYANSTDISIGVASNIYLFSGNSQEGGLVILPGLHVLIPSGNFSTKSGTQTVKASEELIGLYGTASLGYQHIFPGGLNFQIGGGAGYPIIKDKLAINAGNLGRTVEATEEVVPHAWMALGFAF